VHTNQNTDYHQYTDTTPTKTPTITNTPIPQGVLFTTSRLFYGGWGNDLHVVGVIWNNTSANVHINDIIVTFYNAQGAIVGTCSPFPMAYYMAPGQEAPFKQTIYDEPAGCTSYRVSGHYSSTSEEPLKFSFAHQNHYYDGSGDLHVVGEVTNEDTRTTSFMKAYVTLYDAANQIVNCERTYLSELAPGQYTVYDLQIYHNEPNTGWVRYVVGAASLP